MPSSERNLAHRRAPEESWARTSCSLRKVADASNTRHSIRNLQPPMPHHLSPTTHASSLITNHPCLITYHQPPMPHHLSSTTHASSLITNHPCFITYHQPPMPHHLPPTIHASSLTTNHTLFLTTSYQIHCISNQEASECTHKQPTTTQIYHKKTQPTKAHCQPATYQAIQRPRHLLH